MRSMEWIQFSGVILHGNIFLWWWRSHQSLAREGSRNFRFCVMLWKDEREPTIKYCLGGQVDVVKKFITILSFGHNWWWANGIRVEYFNIRIFVLLVHWVHGSEEYHVFCSKFVLLLSILNLLWSVNWLHIRCGTCTRRNRSEFIHCLVMKDQWDCVLNDLEELGDKEILFLMDQYKIESFLVSSDFLPLYSSLFIRPMLRLHKIVPMILLYSRIQSLHHLLEVDDYDEEEYSIVLTLGKRLANNLVAQNQSTFFHRWVWFLWMSWQEYVFVVLLWPLWSAHKSKYIRFQRKIFELHLRNFLLVAVVLLVVAQVRDQLFQAMRNSDPRVRIVLFTDSIPISTP